MLNTNTQHIFHITRLSLRHIYHQATPPHTLTKAHPHKHTHTPSQRHTLTNTHTHPHKGTPSQTHTHTLTKAHPHKHTHAHLQSPSVLNEWEVGERVEVQSQDLKVSCSQHCMYMYHVCCVSVVCEWKRELIQVLITGRHVILRPNLVGVM